MSLLLLLIRFVDGNTTVIYYNELTIDIRKFCLFVFFFRFAQKLKRMKLFLFLTVIVAICCSVTSCSRSQDIEDSDLLFETSKFSCYSIASATKSGELFDERIVVNDSPDLDILMGRCQQTKESGEYEYIALIMPESGDPFTMLCKQTVTCEGILLNYLIDNTETMEFLVPSGGDVRTKGMGEDTMKCIEDVYSNHGWVSFWVWVQTAIIPETAVAFAAACAANQVYTKRKSTKCYVK